jgi:hypothetical protein
MPAWFNTKQAIKTIQRYQLQTTDSKFKGLGFAWRRLGQFRQVFAFCTPPPTQEVGARTCVPVC